MACDIARGRVEPCKDSVGGIKAVYFINNSELGDITYDVTDVDAIATIAGVTAAYKFDVRNASSYTETITSSREASTTYFEQVLELQLPQITKKDHQTIKLLSYGFPHIVIEDNNGNLMLAGLEYGMDVTGGTVTTGSGMAEQNGYTLTFTGMEKKPAALFADTLESVFTEAGFAVTEGVTTDFD